MPEADIRRRFAAGMKKFGDAYKGIVDAWTLYDNSGNVPRVVERGENG